LIEIITSFSNKNEQQQLKDFTLNVSRRRFQEGAYMSHLYQATSSEGMKNKIGRRMVGKQQ